MDRNPILSLNLWLIRKSRCPHVHGRFAVDALPMVKTRGGQALAAILVRHYQEYLRGTRDPDVRFRDFHNHVIHVSGDDWGGATRTAKQWFDRAVGYLRKSQFAEAAHAAGVLCHYFTDPMTPLHTDHDDQEKCLHRPIEWSIRCGYDEIKRLWDEDHLRVVFDMSDRSDWLGEAMRGAARHSHRYYQPILDTYDSRIAVSDPAAALSYVAKHSLAEVFGLAITGWARVLERMAARTEKRRREPLPHPTSLGSSLNVAGGLPMGLLHSFRSRFRGHSGVRELLDEYHENGVVKHNLPTEVDIVHRVVKVHRRELSWRDRRIERQNIIRFVPKEDLAEVPQESEPITRRAA
ncbi:MAG: hypothetical protein AAF664_02875 [Planctomycetota bacterium]